MTEYNVQAIKHAVDVVAKWLNVRVRVVLCWWCVVVCGGVWWCVVVCGGGT